MTTRPYPGSRRPIGDRSRGPRQGRSQVKRVLLFGFVGLAGCSASQSKVEWHAEGPPWEPSPGTELRFQSLYRPISVAIAPSGDHAVVAHLNGLAVYELSSLKVVEHLAPMETEFARVAWHEDGLLIHGRFQGVWKVSVATGTAATVRSTIQGINGSQPEVIFGWNDIGTPKHSLTGFPIDSGLATVAEVFEAREPPTANGGRRQPAERRRVVASTQDGRLVEMVYLKEAPDRVVSVGQSFRLLVEDPNVRALYAVNHEGTAFIYPPDWSEPAALKASLPQVAQATAGAYSARHQVAVLVDAEGGITAHDLRSDMVVHRPGVGRDGVLRAGLLPGHHLFVVDAAGGLWDIDERGPTYRRVRSGVSDAARAPDGRLLVVGVDGWAEYRKVNDGAVGEGTPFVCLRERCTRATPYPLPPEGSPTDGWRLAVAEWAEARQPPERVRLGFVDGHLVTMLVPLAWMAGEGADWTQAIQLRDPSGAVTASLSLNQPSLVRMGDKDLLVGGRRVEVPALRLSDMSQTKLTVGHRQLAIEVDSHAATIQKGTGLGHWDTVRVGTRDGDGEFVPDGSWPPAWRTPELRFVEADVLGNRFLHFSRWSDDPSDNAGGIRVWRHRRDGRIRGAVPGLLAAVPPDRESVIYRYPLRGGERTPPRPPRSQGVVPGMILPELILPAVDTPIVLVRVPPWQGSLLGLVKAAYDWPVYVVNRRSAVDVPRLPSLAFPDAVAPLVDDVVIVHASTVVWRGSRAQAVKTLAAMRVGERASYPDGSEALVALLEPHQKAFELKRNQALQAYRYGRFVEALEAGQFDIAQDRLSELQAKHGGYSGGGPAKVFAMLGQPLDHPQVPELGSGRTLLISWAGGLNEEALAVVDRLPDLLKKMPGLQLVQLMPERTLIRVAGYAKDVGTTAPLVKERGARVVNKPDDIWKLWLSFQHRLHAFLVEDGVVKWMGPIERAEEVLD